MNAKNLKRFILILSVIIPVSAMAQIAGQKSFFPLEESFVVVVVGGSLIVIAGIIYFFAKNMSAFFKVIMDKSKENKIKTFITLVCVSTLLPMFSFAQSVTPADNAPASDTTSWYSVGNMMFLLLLGVYFTLLLIVFWLGTYFLKMVKEIYSNEKPKVEEEIKISWWDRVLDSFNASVPLSKEKDVMLDHDYDGIKELDNSLPPWWLYGFYATIIFAFAYMFYYHMGGPGLSSTEAYAEEVRVANEQIVSMNKKVETTVDESNVTLLADEASLKDAKALFGTVCFTCHGPEGQGGAGPNLTDQYWIHGGDMNSIYKTIKTGVADKGMPQWGATYKPADIQKLASFVFSLQGTNPANPKPQQGTLYEPTVTADSTTAVTDTTTAKK